MNWLSKLAYFLHAIGEQAWLAALADTRIALPDGVYVAPELPAKDNLRNQVQLHHTLPQQT